MIVIVVEGERCDALVVEAGFKLQNAGEPTEGRVEITNLKMDVVESHVSLFDLPRWSHLQESIPVCLAFPWNHLKC